MYDKARQQALYHTTRDFLEEAPARWTSEALDQLKEVLRYHEWRYYIQNDPVISDHEYDVLYKMLEKVEKTRPEWVTPDSPTQRVSDDSSSDFPRVKHLKPMLSLNNSYNAEDLYDFDRQVRKFCGLPEDAVVEYAIEPKYDGGSISLLYENDQLVRGATRGNGAAGDDITANVRTLRSVPLSAPFSDFNMQRVEVRGEAIIRKDLFANINKQRAKAGESLFANPRNTATGGLRMKSPGETAKRGIEVFVYHLAFAQDAQGNDLSDVLKTHYRGLEILEKLGFKIPGKEHTVCQGISAVIEFVTAWERKREDYPYEIDGMVVKVNDLALQEKAGFTSHHPRWAIAYKFKAKQATTQLLDVEYQVGKVGSITPVAKVRPVQLAGVTVTSISLHNEDFIKGKDIRIGDFVVIERSGDVIPYLVKSLEDMRKGDEVPLEFPRFCPLNGEEQVPLEREEGEAAWRCLNCSCGAQPRMRLIWHVSKPAMDIDGLGKSIIERFWDLGWVRDLPDIYRLDYEQIGRLEGFGPKSAENLRQAIEKAKQNPIYRLLHSLSIHHLGKRASRLLAERIGHVLDLQDWTEEQLTDIKDIGPVLAKNVVEWFADPENIAMLQAMEALGVNLQQTAEDRPLEVEANAPLSGKTILFTGSLQEMTRKEAKERAERAGAKPLSAVSSNLDILVVGEKAGSKLRKAEALGTVAIWTEEEFIEQTNA